MELEGVLRVAVGSALLKVTGQVDDCDGLEGALLHADTASDTQLLRNSRNLVIGRYFNAEFSHPDNGTRLLALLATSLGLALVARDNGDPSELVLLRLLLLFLRTH